MGKSFKDERILPPFRQAATDDAGSETSSGDQNFEEYACFGLAHNQVTPAGFKIIYAAGNTAAVYYHDVISPISYDGKGEIQVKIPGAIIRITGKNLQILFDYFFEARIVWIKEPDSSFVEAGEGQPEIESIKIEPRE